MQPQDKTMATGINLQNTSLRISAGTDRQFPSDPMPQIVLSGRSNVGKSSLINTLLGRKALARVSASPGKTITINFYDVDKKLFLVDLPGYGYAKRRTEEQAVWSSLTDRFFTSNPNTDRICLVLQLIDCKVGITNDDAMMLRFLVNAGLPYGMIVTKTDKLNKTDRLAALRKIEEHPLAQNIAIFPFSSHTGEGKNEVWRYILSQTEL